MASFDHDTCELCGALDGKVFKMSEYQVGVTAPPFHPWCRCCTAPYYEDMAGIGERWVRNEDGTTGKVPADTTFEEWRQNFVTEKQAPPQIKPVDVTTAYMKKAAPGTGAVTYDEGYKPGKHKEEIRIAEWLHRTFGGDIKLLNEANALGVKMPDFEWNGKLWELKTTSTLNATDNAVRKALKQIQVNPGGIILDYGDNEIDIDALVETVSKRLARGELFDELDVFMLKNEELLKVLRYKK